MNTRRTLPRSVRRVIWAGVLGNSLELYDFALYGFFAAIIAGQFFPDHDPHAALLATFGIFAAGFLVRPLGALLFGRIGDRYGRKRALEVSILLMTIPTAVMGLLPTYAVIGLMAPVILLTLRILQGLSVAGELVGSYTYLMEHAPPGQKSYVASWSVVGAFAGKILAIVFAAGLALLLTPTQLELWGWRIPFLVGLSFAFSAYRLRKKVSETPAFEDMAKTRTDTHPSLTRTVREQFCPMLFAVGCTIGLTTTIYQVFVFLPVFLVRELGVTYTFASTSNFIALTLGMIAMPIGALIADTVGGRRVLFVGAASLALLALPAYVVIVSGSLLAIVATQSVLGIIFGLIYGPYPAMLAEIFPVHCRYTASAISYNIGVGIFGGMTPLVSTWLISATESLIAPAYWLMACTLTTCFVLIFSRQTQASTICEAAP